MSIEKNPPKKRIWLIREPVLSMRRYSNLSGGMAPGSKASQVKGGRIKEEQLEAEHSPQAVNLKMSDRENRRECSDCFESLRG